MKFSLFPLLTFAVLALGALDMSAQKCKYTIDETDPMTDARVRRTKMTLEGRDFVVNYYRKGDEFRVEMAVALIGERNFVVAEGTELNLKLGNGDIESLQGCPTRHPRQLRGRHAGGHQLQRHVLLHGSPNGLARGARVQSGQHPTRRRDRHPGGEREKGLQDPGERRLHPGRLTS